MSRCSAQSLVDGLQPSRLAAARLEGAYVRIESTRFRKAALHPANVAKPHLRPQILGAAYPFFAVPDQWPSELLGKWAKRRRDGEFRETDIDR